MVCASVYLPFLTSKEEGMEIGNCHKKESLLGYVQIISIAGSMEHAFLFSEK